MSKATSVFSGVAIITAIIAKLAKLIEKLERGIQKCNEQIAINQSEVRGLNDDTAEQENAILKAENLKTKISQLIESK
jgi:predicted PurR-regulated permease PerM